MNNNCTTLDHHENAHTGVHIDYSELYNSTVFLFLIHILGFIGQQLISLPPLVGQIIAGIIWGPMLLALTPYPNAWVLFGEIGLILLVIEAGVDINTTTLKLIGLRGVVIALIGSILPIVIGMVIALGLGEGTKEAFAAGACFGPTSLGIAMNILRTAQFINTPIGQLIVAAAIVDDMIALIILSQLNGLASDITIQGILIPFFSATGYLVIGGYLALFIIPKQLKKIIFWKKSMNHEIHGKLSIFLLVLMVLGLMPATHYSKSSHLMGAFIAGLAFCANHDLHEQFVNQFKRVLQWLMRIFFAATIGFQVPIQNFANGKVLWQGCLFTLALLGKLGVGLLVPNFTQGHKFKGNHLRDCLIVGCSMAAEGEFAFVLASYSVDHNLITKQLYSSIVFAVLLSTIVAPFSLRFVINHFSKRAMEEIENAEKLHLEMENDIEDQLVMEIKEGTTIFLWINITGHAHWGILPKILKTLFDLKLEIIDHRSWHTRFDDSLVNEVYAKNSDGKKISNDNLVEYLEQIEKKFKDAICQNDAIVHVGQWLPGVVDEVFGNEVNGDGEQEKDDARIHQKLMSEARIKLDESEKKSAPIEKIKSSTLNMVKSRMRPGNHSIRTLSTPAGVDMFAEPSKNDSQQVKPLQRRRLKTMSTPLNSDLFRVNNKLPISNLTLSGETPIEIQTIMSIIGEREKGEKFRAIIKNSTLEKLKSSAIPMTLVEELKGSKSQPMSFLKGYVRKESFISTIKEH